MAGYASGSIRVTGLGSDTDFESMIDKLYQVESMQAQKLLKWKQEWVARKDALQKELRVELVSLQEALKKLNTVDKFLAKSFTSSMPEVATVTLGPETEARDYTLQVERLATSTLLSYQTEIEDYKIPMGTTNGTFEFSFNDGEAITINTTSQTTLEGLVNMINNNQKNKDIKASIVKTETGYALQMRSKDPGVDTKIAVTTTGVGGFDDHDWVTDAPPEVTNQAGQNAKFFLDGSATAIYSSSNNISDVVPGITFNLRSVSSTPTFISVRNDLEKVTENIQTFVDSVNKVRQKILDLTAIDAAKQVHSIDYVDSQFDAQKGAILTGNYGVQLVSSKLRSIIASTGIGFVNPSATSDGDYFSSLSQIGIMTNANQSNEKYGLLEITETSLKDSAYGTLSLKEALERDPEAIARLFAADMDASVYNTTAFSYQGHLGSITNPGTYSVEYTVDGSGNVQGTIGGMAANYNPDTHELTSIEGPSRGLVILINDFSTVPSPSHSGEINMRQGKVNELLGALQGSGKMSTTISLNGEPVDLPIDTGILDDRYGALTIIEQNYQSIINNIDKKIMKEDERLVTWERRMRLKFARLEQTLATYNSKLENLKSQISSLSTSSSNK